MSQLKKIYEGFNDKKKEAVRNSIIKDCGFNQFTFYRKLRKPESISKLEQPKFAKRLGVPVEKLFPVKLNASPRVKKTIAA